MNGLEATDQNLKRAIWRSYKQYHTADGYQIAQYLRRNNIATPIKREPSEHPKNETETKWCNVILIGL